MGLGCPSKSVLIPLIVVPLSMTGLLDWRRKSLLALLTNNGLSVSLFELEVLVSPRLMPFEFAILFFTIVVVAPSPTKMP